MGALGGRWVVGSQWDKGLSCTKKLGKT